MRNGTFLLVLAKNMSWTILHTVGQDQAANLCAVWAIINLSSPYVKPKAYVDIVDQDKTAQNLQSDLDSKLSACFI